MRRKIIRVLRKVLGAQASPEDNWVSLREYIDIHPTAIIGKNASISIPVLPKVPKILVTIREHSQVFGNLVLNNENAEIHIGKNCQIGASNLIAASRIEIGDDVIMSWGCTILDSDNHSLMWKLREGDVERARLSYIQTGGSNIVVNQRWDKAPTKPIRICNKTFIGMNSVILKGVVIGEESVIGANTVIRSSVASKSICIGNPAIVTGKVRE